MPDSASGAASGQVSVVIITRNRRESLLNTLERLQGLPERPAIVVVDNGSTDGSAQAVRAGHPGVVVIEAGRNLGAAARNLGVARARTPYIAFSDDDSWWAPGALTSATAVLDHHPAVGLVAARVLVGPDDDDDPLNEVMARSALPASASVPGRPVIGFLACAAIVRRTAFLAAGGFHPRFGVGGEETLLALDLRRLHWEVIYLPDVVAHHHPSPRRDDGRRDRHLARNALWTAWLRLPLRDAVAQTIDVLKQCRNDPHVRRGMLDALFGAPGVLRERDVVGERLALQWRLVRQL